MIGRIGSDPQTPLDRQRDDANKFENDALPAQGRQQGQQQVPFRPQTPTPIQQALEQSQVREPVVTENAAPVPLDRQSFAPRMNPHRH